MYSRGWWTGDEEVTAWGRGKGREGRLTGDTIEAVLLHEVSCGLGELDTQLWISSNQGKVLAST